MVVVDSLNLNTLMIISKTMGGDVKDDSPDLIFRCTITNKAVGSGHRLSLIHI